MTNWKLQSVVFSDPGIPTVLCWQSRLIFSCVYKNLPPFTAKTVISQVNRLTAGDCITHAKVQLQGTYQPRWSRRNLVINMLMWMKLMRISQIKSFSQIPYPGRLLDKCFISFGGCYHICLVSTVLDPLSMDICCYTCTCSNLKYTKSMCTWTYMLQASPSLSSKNSDNIISHTLEKSL